MTEVAIDSAVLERLIFALAQFGAYGGTGVRRTVYSAEWLAATKAFAQWCREAGLAVHNDAVGNVWGKLVGSESTSSIVSGSHIDTQTPGGRYDGALGAVGGLIAIKSLHEQFGQPRRSLEVVAFCEEEGSRFPKANFWGSRAVTGSIASSEPELVRDFETKSIADAMLGVGLDPKRISEARRKDIDYFLELHIEQGPILEAENSAVGIVTAITGLRHYLIELEGTANHAGAFPMDARRDPMAGFAEIATTVIDRAAKWGRPAVTTVGRVLVEPNFPAIVPEKVTFMIDVRHPNPDEGKRLYDAHEATIREVAARRGLGVRVEVLEDQPATICHRDLVVAIEEAAERQI